MNLTRGITSLLFAIMAFLPITSNASMLTTTVTVSKFLYDGDPEADHIIEFKGPTKTGSLFDSRNAKVVELYSPYCGHCIAYKPEYIKSTSSIRKEHPELEFHAVSCAAFPDVCKEFEVRGVPALWLIPEGVQKDYTKHGIRINTDKVNWVDIQQELSSRQLVVESQELDGNGGGGIGYAKQAKDVDEPDKLANENQVEDTAKEIAKNPMDSGDLQDDEEDEADAAENPMETGDETDEQGIDSTDKSVFSKDDEADDTGSFDANSVPLSLRSGTTADVDDSQSEQSETGGIVKTFQKILFGDEDEDGDEDGDFEAEEDQLEWLEDEEEEEVPRAGAELAREKTHAMDKYNAYYKSLLEKRKNENNSLRKKGSEQQFAVIDTAEGATPTMKAYQVNTKEYLERRQKYIDFLKKNYEKNKKLDVDLSAIEKGKIGKLPYQKRVPTGRSRLVEDVPVIKRIVKMSAEEELILDASLSVIHGLTFGVYKTRASISADDRRALDAWLSLLDVALPPEWSIHSLIYALKSKFSYVTERYTNLKEVLDENKMPRARWSKSCKGNDATYCGFWKLLHVISLGVAEHRGGLNLIDSGVREQGTRTFSPEQAADVIREYVARFFHDPEYADEFIRDYDDCDKNRRCARLASDQYLSTDQDWKEVALWLWEFHNDVNVRLLNKEADRKRTIQQQALFRRMPAGPGIAPTEHAIKVLWPNLDACVTCFNFDGTWNEAAVFRHLERTYWPDYDINFSAKNEKLVWLDGDEVSSPKLTYLLFFALVLLFYNMKRSLSAPHMKRTILLAKSIVGPKVILAPKKRSA